MHIKEAIFATSAANHTQCPVTDKVEVAFIGRSNVGKSSLLNMLVDRKKLAKTSATPGKTQLINHFLINKSYYCVDLPGYGWAQASKALRLKWTKMVNEYLLARENLRCLFVLIDINLPPQAIDIEFINWLNNSNIYFCIVLTKADKISKQKIFVQLTIFQKSFSITSISDNPIKYFVSSSKKKLGRLELLNFIDETINT